MAARVSNLCYRPFLLAATGGGVLIYGCHKSPQGSGGASTPEGKMWKVGGQTGCMCWAMSSARLRSALSSCRPLSRLFCVNLLLHVCSACRDPALRGRRKLAEVMHALLYNRVCALPGERIIIIHHHPWRLEDRSTEHKIQAGGHVQSRRRRRITDTPVSVRALVLSGHEKDLSGSLLHLAFLPPTLPSPLPLPSSLVGVFHSSGRLRACERLARLRYVELHLTVHRRAGTGCIAGPASRRLLARVKNHAIFTQRLQAYTSTLDLAA